MRKKTTEEGVIHSIHLNNRATEPIGPGKYKIGIDVRPTLDKETAVRESLNNREIEEAMTKTSKLEVEFNIEK